MTWRTTARSRWWWRCDPQPAGDLARDGSPRGDGEHPVDRRRVGRIARRPLQPAADGSAGEGDGRGGERPGVGRVDRRGGRRRAAPSSRDQVGGAERAAATTSRPAISASSGSSSWRTRLRDEAGVVVGRVGDERRGRGRAQPRGLRRRSASSGRVGPGAIAARPSSPRAAEQVDQHGLGLVVGGVAGEHAGGQRADLASRALGLEVRAGRDVRRVEPTNGDADLRRPAPARASASAADSGRRPWSTWTARDIAARRRRRAASSAVESAPPEKAQSTPVPGGGKCSDRSESAVAERRRDARITASVVAAGASLG